MRKDEWLNIIKDLEHTFNTTLTSMPLDVNRIRDIKRTDAFPGDDVKRIDESRLAPSCAHFLARTLATVG